MKVIQMMMNEFEEWMGNYDCCPTPEAYSAAKAAYQAGAAAMLERCAEVTIYDKYYTRRAAVVATCLELIGKEDV